MNIMKLIKKKNKLSSGLSPEMCEKLIKDHHIYLLKSGRISLAGLNQANLQYVIDSIDQVVRSEST